MKKILLCATLDFFHRPYFFQPFTLPYKLKKNIFLQKNPLNYFSLKVTTFYSDSVKNESARTKKLQGGRQTPPPQPEGLIKSKEFHSDSVKNECKGKKTKVGEGVERPPPACLGLKPQT